MSTAVQNQVFEAELVVAADPNPYQSPIAAKPTQEITDGIGRATKSRIESAILGGIVAETTFVASWVCYLAYGMTGFSYGLLGMLYFAIAFVAWICFVWMVLTSDELSLISVAAIFMYPIPIFGSLLFFAFKNSSNRFLIRNGYRPAFLGASPDPHEILLMNQDPYYRPMAKYHHDGSKRRVAWSISDWFFIATVAIMFAMSLPGIFGL